MRWIAVITLACLGLGSSALECSEFMHIRPGEVFGPKAETCEPGEVCMAQFTKTETNGKVEVQPHRNCVKINPKTKMGCSITIKDIQVSCYCDTNGCNAERMYGLQTFDDVMNAACSTTFSWVSFTAVLVALVVAA
ncbi:uncharacterized protein LOC129592543 [Paramacrobiotus metropolitanus]|uniref:uncharacterized protein LOC129592543 n=1 Tax=Paramacrobiotus metropolitanus TaxID=2943436 RepID=UPI00244610DD|nr:uncharacterized protein LOC129592543 [Paramacrobiotus metropolitanus]